MKRKKENRCPTCGGRMFALSGRSTYNEISTLEERKIKTSHTTVAECTSGHEWVLEADEKEETKPPDARMISI